MERVSTLLLLLASLITVGVFVLILRAIRKLTSSRGNEKEGEAEKIALKEKEETPV